MVGGAGVFMPVKIMCGMMDRVPNQVFRIGSSLGRLIRSRNLNIVDIFLSHDTNRPVVRVSGERSFGASAREGMVG